MAKGLFNLVTLVSCVLGVVLVVCEVRCVRAEELENPLGLHRLLLREEWGVETYGWAIAHKKYDIELPQGIVNLSIVAVSNKGIHEDIESRAADVAERLVIAWYLMEAPVSLVHNMKLELA